jgi:glycosyltransferase involved in cell wall biosynthesis
MRRETTLDILIHTLGLPVTGEDPVEVASGGSEAAAVSMARALQRQGHTVGLCCVTDQPRRVAGVDVIPHQDTQRHAAGRSCDVLISSRHHDVLTQRLPARLIALWHHDMPRAGPFARIGPALSKSTSSLFVSRFQRDAFEQLCPGISERALVTSNGVDFDAIEAVTAEPPAGSRLRFLFASRPERGLHFLLDRIWPRVRERYPDAELLTASYLDRCLEPTLQPYYEACDLLACRTPGVRRLGALPRRDFWRLLAGCAAVLYPASWPETSCMAALEAQALGVPVVTSATAALPETVAFADTLVRASCPSEEYIASFLDKVVRLVEDEEFARRARDAGKRHVSRESHSWDSIAGRWSEHFHQLFADRFATRKAGILRRLLRAGDLGAAAHLAAAEPAASFDPADLADLEERTPAGLPDRRPGLDTDLERTPPLPKISATLLVKNGEDHLRRCIDSIAEVADEIILGDTGSTDGTLEIAAEMGFVRPAPGDPSPQLLRRRLVSVTFRDFAQARNDLARHATGDYILWQDADEILIHPEELREWIDGNVYFDGFSWEQRHIIADLSFDPDHPVRCFKRPAQDGARGWFGCIHEVVETRLNHGPGRVLPVPGVRVDHFGYGSEPVRQSKCFERNLPLLIRDRRENPDRHLGYLLGLRDYLNIAKLEIKLSGDKLTEKAYLYLNYGFEIWDQHLRHFPAHCREAAFGYSREILAILAQFRMPLRKTGTVPFWAQVAMSAAPVGGEGIEGRIAAVFSSIAELRETTETNLRAIEQFVSRQRPCPPLPITAESPAEWRHLDLPPQPFGLEP